jgi:TorA maturation chaperone TorD
VSPEERVETDARVWELLARGARFRLLALAFAYPEPGLLAELRGTRWPELDREPRALGRAQAAFRAACAAAEADGLVPDYLGLFDGRVRCSPYESGWGDARRLGGKEAELADIAGFQAAFGVEPSRRHPEMPDHIGAELELMSVLSLKEAYALFHGIEEGREVAHEARRAFLRDHLGRWAGAFATELEAAAANGFYRAAAALLREVVAEECRALGVTPAPAGGPAPAEPDEIGCPFARGREEEA